MWYSAYNNRLGTTMYFKECISRTGHITLVIISENPLNLQLYPNKFSDELFLDNVNRSDLSEEFSREISTNKMQAAVELTEDDLGLKHGNKLDFNKIRKKLSEVLTDPETDNIIGLVSRINQKHQNFES